MKDFFSKHIGKSISNLSKSINEKDVLYCIIHVPFLNNSQKDVEYVEKIKKLFEIIVETNGDVNQFCCGILLALYGVPIEMGDKYRYFRELLSRIVAIKDIRAIAGETNSLYGAFGFEKRMVITAINSQIEHDCKNIINMPHNRIMIYEPLWVKIGVIADAGLIEVI